MVPDHCFPFLADAHTNKHRCELEPSMYDTFLVNAVDTHPKKMDESACANKHFNPFIQKQNPPPTHTQKQKQKHRFDTL